ncbi:MAG TPA: ankyrin repeat domain-containing protein [Kofleriaceae bacterium]|jgi:hypothetical protein
MGGGAAASWGKTTDLALEPPGADDGGEWDLPYWIDVVFPNAQGEIHHGSTGALMPDAVVVRLEGRPVALADAYPLTLENQYCWDAEYYLVLRLREILAPAGWRTLPWAALEPGDVFIAWDKFHGHTYSRTPGAHDAMSYGGDWGDLQTEVDAEHPRPEGPRPIGRPSDATLLRAVRAGDLALVRSLLAAGANPDAGWDAPVAAVRSVSVDRNSPALWEAVVSGSPELTEALLAAGASVNRASPGGMGMLHSALANQKLEVIPVLLCFGADPDDTWQGRTAREVAESLSPSAAALFAAAPRRG